MTYKEICKKIGFDPIVDGYPYPIADYEDDSQPSPFAPLNYDELDFLYDYLVEHKEEVAKHKARRAVER